MVILLRGEYKEHKNGYILVVLNLLDVLLMRNILPVLEEVIIISSGIQFY